MPQQTVRAHPVLDSTGFRLLMQDIGHVPPGSDVLVDLRPLQYVGLFELTLLAMLSYESSSKRSGRRYTFVVAEDVDEQRVGTLKDEPVKSAMRRRSNIYRHISALDWIRWVEASAAARVEVQAVGFREYIGLIRAALGRRTWRDASRDLPLMSGRIVAPLTSILTELDLRANFAVVAHALREGMRGTCDPVVSDGFAHEVLLEVCDNVSKHNASEATVGWVCARRLHRDGRMRTAEQGGWSSGLLSVYYPAELLEVVVADNGHGIWHTLGTRVKGPDYKKELSEEQAIRDAFERQDGEQVRRGLFDARHRMLDLNAGFIGARSGHARVAFTFTPFTVGDPPRSVQDAYPVKGTQVLMRLAAEEARRVQVSLPGYEQQLSIPGILAKSKELPLVRAASVCWPSAISDRAAEAEIALSESLSSASRQLTDTPGALLCVDLSGASGLRTGQLDRILQPVVDQCGPSVLQRVVLVNCDDEVLDRLTRTRVLDVTRGGDLFLLALSRYNIPRVLSRGMGGDVAAAIAQICVMQRVPLATLNEAWGGEVTERVRMACSAGGLLRTRETGPEAIAEFTPVLAAMEARFRDSFEQALEETGALTTEGHYELPCGDHAEMYFESRLLLQRSSLTTLLAKQLALMLREYGVYGGRSYVLYTYSMTGQILADELRYWVNSRRCVTGVDYSRPWPVERDADLRQGDDVIIVTDVVASGRLLAQMAAHCRDAGANLVGVATIANLSDSDEIAARRIAAIYRRKVERHPAPCPKCREGIPLRQVDRFTLAARPLLFPERPTGPDENGDSQTAQFRWGEFWGVIQRSPEVLISGHQRGKDGRCYLHRFDTHRLLGHERIRSLVQAAMTEFFEGKSPATKLRGCVDCIIHPGAIDNPAAVQIARMAARALGCPPGRQWLEVVMAHRHRLYGWDLAPESAAAMSGKRVLVVDDGANTGRTLFELAGLALGAGAESIAGFYVMLNRLPEAMHRFCVRHLNNFGYFLRLRLPVFPQGRCPVCERIAELDRQTDTSLSGGVRRFVIRKRDSLSGGTPAK